MNAIWVEREHGTDVVHESGDFTAVRERCRRQSRASRGLAHKGQSPAGIASVPSQIESSSQRSSDSNSARSRDLTVSPGLAS